MGSEWAAARLGEVTNLLTGFPFQSDRYVGADETAPRLLRGDNVAQGTLRWDGAKHWPTEELDDVSEYWLREHDVILAMDRPWIDAGLKYASVRPTDVPSLLVQRVARLRGTDRLDTRFLKYLIASKAFTDYVLAVQTGTAVPHISSAQIKGFEFLLPPIVEQLAIASILGALDDKIEVHRRMNVTLEEMARALFQSWFVDFDPVRAKAEGRDSGLPTTVSDLFPGSLNESDGGIPAGWRVRPIDEVVGDMYDGPHATPPESDSGPIFLGIQNLTGAGLDLSDVRHIGEDRWDEWTRRITPKPGDIVFSYEATLGFFALIPQGLRCCLGRRLALVRPKADNGYGHFWFHQFISAPFQRFLDRHSIHGATVNRIPLIEFPRYPVLDPPDVVKSVFDCRVASLWQRIHANQSGSRTLAVLRDTLLPKLLSGELRVKQAERLVEDIGV